MEIDNIQINGSNLDKNKLIQLIENDGKHEAIKYVKVVSRLGLSKSKEIVENLYENPNYYDNDVVEISNYAKQRMETDNGTTAINRPTRKGNHVINEGTSTSRLTITTVVAIIITLILYFLIRSF